MKKLLTAVLSLTLLGTAVLPILAVDSETPMVVSPGPEVTASDQEPLTAPGFSVEVDGSSIDVPACVMVPLRAVAEKLGFTVTWDKDAVTVTGPERYARLIIGENEYFAAPIWTWPRPSRCSKKQWMLSMS